jgi:glycosyltransferase involved in cell wall biosynthesis
MRVALCSSYVPFIRSGARHIVDWLDDELRGAGHQVEKVYLPEADTPDLLFKQMMAYRWVDLSAADRIICFRPQAHLIQHRHKILWFIHHIRSFYDLWDTEYRGFPDDVKHRGIREALQALDTRGMREAKTIFTNSKVVSGRLKTFNGLDSRVLYPPLARPEKFHSAGLGDEIVCVCRVESHKRQHLLVEAIALTRSPVRLRICGASAGAYYPWEMQQRIRELGLSKRVVLENRWISDEEKVDLLAHCLAAAYLPFDEDSYGYPSIEACHSSKPVLTTSDSGGVLELIRDGVDGYIAEPTPISLASAMDALFIDRAKTKQMGLNARSRLDEMNISWAHVLQSILA